LCEDEDEVISMLDVEAAMGKMIHGKATGENEISTEMIKAGELVRCQWLYRALKNILKELRTRDKA
jgi:hypothetical protein